MQSGSAESSHLPQICVSQQIDEMKSIIVLILAVACVNCIPFDSTSSKPINQDVESVLKPEEPPSNAQEYSESHGTNIQKVPTKGTKLSFELDTNESSTTEKSSRTKRDSFSKESSGKSVLKQAEESGLSTHAPKHGTTTTAEPVSLKTPITHATGTKAKRSADGSEVAITNHPTSTRAPVPSSSSFDDRDNTGPHFVRPVPVEQILKNIHEAPKHHLPSPISLHHEDAETVATTTTESSNDSNHKTHHKSANKQPESKQDEKLEDEDETKEDQEDEEENRK